jgi:hypothetical protein
MHAFEMLNSDESRYVQKTMNRKKEEEVISSRCWVRSQIKHG